MGQWDHKTSASFLSGEDTITWRHQVIKTRIVAPATTEHAPWPTLVTIWPSSTVAAITPNRLYVIAKKDIIAVLPPF